MANPYLRARQTLSHAVYILATRPEDIRGRLPYVYPILAELGVDDLPAAL